MTDSHESPYHHKRRLEAAERERRLLERENQVLRLQAERLMRKERLYQCQTKSRHVHEEDDEKVQSARVALVENLIDACTQWIIDNNIKWIYSRDTAQRILREAIEEYVDHEWSAHLAERYGADDAPDLALVHHALEYYFEHRNSILDSEGAVFERQKGPLGVKKPLRERLWVLLTDGVSPPLKWILLVTGIVLLGCLLYKMPGLNVGPKIILSVVLAVTLVLLLLAFPFTLSRRRGGDGNSKECCYVQWWRHRLNITPEDAERLRVARDIASRTKGTPSKYDLRSERRHYHLHDVLGRWSAGVTWGTGVFMVGMMIAGALQLLYAISFAMNIDPIFTRFAEAVNKGAEEVRNWFFVTDEGASAGGEMDSDQGASQEANAQEGDREEAERPAGDTEESGYKAAMTRALIALEMILLAPLPYLLMVGLTRYIKALAFREQVDEFRRELLDFKSFEVALFIAIIAAATVSQVLDQNLTWQQAVPAGSIIVVLTLYFFVIEWRAREDERLDIYRERLMHDLETARNAEDHSEDLKGASSDETGIDRADKQCNSSRGHKGKANKSTDQTTVAKKTKKKKHTSPKKHK